MFVIWSKECSCPSIHASSPTCNPHGYWQRSTPHLPQNHVTDTFDNAFVPLVHLSALIEAGLGKGREGPFAKSLCLDCPYGVSLCPASARVLLAAKLQVLRLPVSRQLPHRESSPRCMAWYVRTVHALCRTAGKAGFMTDKEDEKSRETSVSVSNTHFGPRGRGILYQILPSCASSSLCCLLAGALSIPCRAGRRFPSSFQGHHPQRRPQVCSAGA